MVNGGMGKSRKSVSGVYAPAARPTVLGAAIVTVLVTTPFAVVILLVDAFLI